MRAVNTKGSGTSRKGYDVNTVVSSDSELALDICGPVIHVHVHRDNFSGFPTHKIVMLITTCFPSLPRRLGERIIGHDTAQCAFRREDVRTSTFHIITVSAVRHTGPKAVFLSLFHGSRKPSENQDRSHQSTAECCDKKVRTSILHESKNTNILRSS